MREALSPYTLELSSRAVVHQWAPKQYVQRSSCMPEAHARVYREHAALHAQLLMQSGPAPSCSSAAAPKCALICVLLPLCPFYLHRAVLVCAPLALRPQAWVHVLLSIACTLVSVCKVLDRSGS